MALNLDVTGVVAELRNRAKRLGNAKAVVGYSAPYAIYVHEDLTKHHPNGQAKFLEEPARRFHSVFGRMLAEGLRQRRPVGFTLLQIAEELLAESQKLVPVDTGFLKGSGYAGLGT